MALVVEVVLLVELALLLATALLELSLFVTSRTKKG
jgi:hypothetical protein